MFRIPIMVSTLYLHIYCWAQTIKPIQSNKIQCKTLNQRQRSWGHYWIQNWIYKATNNFAQFIIFESSALLPKSSMSWNAIGLLTFIAIDQIDLWVKPLTLNNNTSSGKTNVRTCSKPYKDVESWTSNK